MWRPVVLHKEAGMFKVSRSPLQRIQTPSEEGFLPVGSPAVHGTSSEQSLSCALKGRGRMGRQADVG